ncbi:hypothetical protein [Chromobacterium amazonense]|uniref:DUF4105 domain-containing protein n=1 Tax=Chromobacterium amazonense TaxID=1382803 RepID=A0ABU8V6U5_9NEIS|nr:hypothetical protein [Chromobacterium amazonense]MDQ4539091.1 hypothetical protein [Chromobacterium amazonense]
MAMAQPKTTTAKTQPKEKNAVVEHRDDVYVLVIGFEVNNPQVYRETDMGDGTKRKVHYVLEDPGHTFMYLTKNLKITFFYSLGPAYHDPVRRAYGPGTADFHIPGATRLYRFVLTEAQYEKMLAKGKEYRADVAAGTRYYNVFQNFTCARSARDIIAVGWPSVPKGESVVGNSQIAKDMVVNPYAFYEDIHNKYGSSEIELGDNERKWKIIMETVYDSPGTYPDPTMNKSSWLFEEKKEDPGYMSPETLSRLPENMAWPWERR